MKDKSHDTIEAAFNGELQTAPIERAPTMTAATLANTTTLQDIERKRRINRAVVMVLTLLGTVALGFAPIFTAPASLIIGGVAALFFIVAVVIAYFTNAMTPEEIEGLLMKLAGAGDKVRAMSEAAAQKKEGDK